MSAKRFYIGKELVPEKKAFSLVPAPSCDGVAVTVDISFLGED